MRLMTLLGFVAVLSGTACAQGDGQVEAQAAPSPWAKPARTAWTLSFEPRVWYQAPSGDITFPGGATADDEIEMEVLNIDEPEASPYGELRFQRGPWRIEIAGAAFDSDASSTMDATRVLGDVAVFAGERARFDFSHASFEARGLYQIAQYVDGSTSDGRDIFRFGVHVGAGLRLTNIDFDFAVTPTDAGRTGGEVLALSYSHTFAEPMLAAAAEIRLYERFTIGLESTVGWFSSGDTSSSSFSIEPTFGWRPVDNVGIEIGYRMLIHDLEDGEDTSQFEWGGSMAGLFAGLSVQF